MADLKSVGAVDEGRGVIKGPRVNVQTGGGAQPLRVNLKNGRTRQPYEAVIEGYETCRMRDDGGTGLTLSQAGVLSGGAMPAGDYLMLVDAQASGKSVTLGVRLSVIADPRDLWKDIPSDQNAPFAKPDTAFEIRTGAAFIAGASVRGRSHAQEGKYREDHFCIHADAATGWHMLVVADGAGSAHLSREGSRIACETVIEALPALLAQHADGPMPADSAMLKERMLPVLPQAALRAAHAIEAQAAALGHPAQDFATTLVIAVSRKMGAHWLTASFTVGDGGVALYDAGTQDVHVMCRPDSGEFAGQTRFLTSAAFEDSADVQGRLFVDVRSDFTVLAAMSDGIADPKFPTDVVFARPAQWHAFWHDDLLAQVVLNRDNPQLEAQMLAWMGFWSRGNHDDRTLVLMVPEGDA